ncbi:ATP-grasp fold amidoligase family protein [Pseudonocardia pini]|uniref:ATP-grasp fold amidoligase family protein n=1 Tax=Pseudonocardia pini TaxID=2758030 RepID=UPI0015F00B74|nr:ATP-grasp fold amidoligase family protein [Pseudonocardia pini]
MTIDARVLLARRLRFLPDRPFALAKHALFQGELTSLRRPRTWSQLLAAKNLEPQSELVHRTSDKYEVRAHVADKVGEQILIPLYSLLTDAADLDFDALPGPCVIKGTHGCDMTILLPDPTAADRAAIRETVRRWLRTDFYRHGWRESPYRGLQPRAVVEEFIGTPGGAAPTDYKFFMFHGEPGMVVVDQDRFTGHTSTMLTPEWREFAVSGRFAFAERLPERPDNYPEMLEVARALSKDFAFVRIDLYNVEGRIFFGEITHNPGGGLVRLQPREFDLALGEMWRTGTPVPERFVRS